MVGIREELMIRRCLSEDTETICDIVDDAAQAYRGVIPADCWHEPYMSHQQLEREIESCVVFWGYEEDGRLQGVMGLQHMGDVTLIRHAYVRSTCRRRGIGSQLLSFLRAQTSWTILVGTWADATWAVRFYEKHGFRQVPWEDKERLLRRYWTVPEQQIATSVVLAEEGRIP